MLTVALSLRLKKPIMNIIRSNWKKFWVISFMAIKEICRNLDGRGRVVKGAKKLYDFESWFETIRHYQECSDLSTEARRTLRWIGNEESGGDHVAENSTRKLSEILHRPISAMVIRRTQCSLGEADVSLRSGWFYHAESAAQIFGWSAGYLWIPLGIKDTLLLNVPPTKEGLLAEERYCACRNFTGSFRVATDILAYQAGRL